MGVMGVIAFHIVSQARVNIVSRMAIATVEQTPGEDAQPPLDLMQPGAMLRRNIAPMLVRRIAQEGPPLGTTAQLLRAIGPVAPLGDQTTDRQAPVGIEVVYHPVVTLHRGELLDDRGQRGGKGLTGARRPQLPDDLSRGNTA